MAAVTNVKHTFSLYGAQFNINSYADNVLVLIHRPLLFGPHRWKMTIGAKCASPLYTTLPLGSHLNSLYM